MTKYQKWNFIQLPNKHLLKEMWVYAKAVWVSINSYSNDNWLCFPSVNTLSKENNCCKNSILKWIKELEKLKVIKKISRKKDGKNSSNLYQIIILEKDEEIDFSGSWDELGGSWDELGGGSWDDTELYKSSITKTTKQLKEKLSLEFYEKYPKKVDKKDSLKKYVSLLKKYKHEDILEWLEMYKRKWEQEQTSIQFIPSPLVWLNKQKWQDELETKKEETKPKKDNTFYYYD